MGIDTHRFVATVPNALICTICNDVLDNPVQCPTNQHIFCLECITHWLEDHKSCPLDREELSAAQLQPARVIALILEDYDVKCEFFGNGCKVVMRFGSINEHGANCEFDYVAVIARKDRLLKKYVDEVKMLNRLLKDAQLDVELANARIDQLSRGPCSNTDNSGQVSSSLAPTVRRESHDKVDPGIKPPNLTTAASSVSLTVEDFGRIPQSISFHQQILICKLVSEKLASPGTVIYGLLTQINMVSFYGNQT